MPDEIVMKQPGYGCKSIYMNRGRRYQVGSDGMIFGVDPIDVATLQATGWRIVDRANSDECL